MCQGERMSDDQLPFLLLAASNAAVDAIQAGVRERGYADIRPAHGFAFVRISGGGCTLVELADHLGMTKQSASTLVAELEAKGYVARSPHPRDGRSTLITLTAKGIGATQAATEAGREFSKRWRRQLSAARVDALATDLALMAGDGRVRPIW